MSDGTPDFSLYKLAAGVAGSFASLKFVQGSITERMFMWVGGASFSYYSTAPIANWANVPDAEGLIGFTVGLLAMTIVAKMFEVIQLLDAKEIAKLLWTWVKRKWGA